MFKENTSDISLNWPQKGLSLDNAAMIAGLAYHKFKKNLASSLDVEAKTSFSSF